MPFMRGVSILWKEAFGRKDTVLDLDSIQFHEVNQIRDWLVGTAPGLPIPWEMSHVYNAFIAFCQKNFINGALPSIDHVSRFVNNDLRFDCDIYRDSEGVIHCHQRK